VDDDPMNVNVLTHQIKSCKQFENRIEIFYAYDGKQCRNIYEVNKYDLIFMDNVLPDSRGHDLVKEILEI